MEMIKMAVINATTNGETTYQTADKYVPEKDTLTDNSRDYLRLLSKIQEAKESFMEMKIKKTGRNNYQKYDYFTLDDIVPPVLKICNQLNLAVKFEFNNHYGILICYDLETGSSTNWVTPLPEFEKGRDASKSIQSIQTYARRSLYLQFLEIVEPNEIEEQKPAKNKKTVIKSEKKPENTLISSNTKKEDKKEEKPLFEITQSMATKLSFAGIPLNKQTLTAEANNRLHDKKINKNQHKEIIKLINETY